MNYFKRSEVLEIVGVGDDFLIALESEEIIGRDAPPEASGEYSEQMLERIRVASNLVHEFDVNLPGVAIIVRMRERMAHHRHVVDEFVAELEKRRP